MTDEEVASVVKRYRTATPTLSGEFPEKAAAISEVEGLLPRSEARAFLLDVLRSPDEYDLARVEVCKVLESHPLPDFGNPEEFIDALLVVVEDNGDVLVQQWAARALRNFAAFPQIVKAAVRVVHNPAMDIDVRHNALASVGAAIEPGELAALRSLLMSATPELTNQQLDLRAERNN